jgi:hypothetical protein
MAILDFEKRHLSGALETHLSPLDIQWSFPLINIFQEMDAFKGNTVFYLFFFYFFFLKRRYFGYK